MENRRINTVGQKPLIVALGVNHLTAPVELRELFACKLDEKTAPELSYLSNLKGVRELMILSTCNRVEIYAVVNDKETIDRLLTEFIALKTDKNPEKFKKYFFIKTGTEAVEHILSIPAGLSSMVLGETQIASQFKEALKLARRYNTIGEILNKLADAALRAGKRVRTETDLSKTPVSVSYIAVLLAKQIFGVLEGVKVLVVGAGEMAELTAEYLKREKAKIFVTNRTFERATALAKKIGAGVIEWEEFKNFLKETDIVIVSTGSPDYIITKRDVEKLVKKRFTPLVFIDISVPRNVDPSISELPNVFLFNIDNLKEIADKNLKTRNEEAKKGWLIVREEALKFQKWLDSFSTRLYPQELKKLIEELKQLTLQETDGKEEALEVFSKKIMHPLFVLIKQNPQAGQILIEELKQIVEKKKKAL